MSKTAVITGSSGGIGVELVKVFIENGYKVLGLDLLKAPFKQENYVHITTNLEKICLDINFKDKLIEEITSNIPNGNEKLVLVNNAALQVLGSLSNLDSEDWIRSMNVNCIAPFLITQGLKHKLETNNGSVVNVLSIHTSQTKRNFSCYAASKSALESLTRSMALELSPFKIRVNGISPAAISTDMLLEGFKDTPELLNELESFHPSKQIGKPDELSHLIYLIANSNDNFLTGSIINYHGGIGGQLSDPEI